MFRPFVCSTIRRLPAAVRSSALRRAAFWSTAGLLVAGLAASALATWRPSWYRPAAVDYGRLLDDKQALAALESRISAALNAGRPVRVELRQEDVNRWLSARRELWMESPLDVAGLQHPCVRFRAGAVEAGAMLTGGRGGAGGRPNPPSLPWNGPGAGKDDDVSAGATDIRPRAVVSGRVSARPGREHVEIKLECVLIGALPIPLRLLEHRLRALARHDWGGLGVEPSGGLRLRNAFTWPNGRCRFRFGEITFGSGVLIITLEPLGGSSAR